MSREIKKLNRRLSYYVSALLAVFVTLFAVGGVKKTDDNFALKDFADFARLNTANAETSVGGENNGDSCGSSAADASADNGGASNGGGGAPCFAPDTPIMMADGSSKLITDVQLGDLTLGGRVTGVMQFLTYTDSMYNYKGVRVTGSHPVNDNGTWRYVEDCAAAVKVADLPDLTVHLLNTEQHRVYVNGLEFSDFIEIDSTHPLKATYLHNLMLEHQRQEDEKQGVATSVAVA